MTMSARLRDLLDEGNIRYRLMTHSPALTAQEGAATLHVPAKELAKTVVVRAGDETLLAVLPATCRISLKKLSAVVGKAFRLATEQELGSLFPDCEVGAMPPFGQLCGLPVYVDEALANDVEIVFNAGTHREAIRMRYADYCGLAKPSVRLFAEKG
jgi:Ala-tRNA(Pro) deacylase